jgi:hypothetical protein
LIWLKRRLIGCTGGHLPIDVKYSFHPLHLYALRMQVIDAWRSADALSSQYSPRIIF